MAEAAEIVQQLAAARAGSRAALGQALEACRHYLLHVANRELGGDLQAKAGASDLVQETFLEAQRDFAQFDGQTEAALLAWLSRLLTNNVANFSRRYHTRIRQVDREVGWPAQPPAASAGTASAQLMARERDQALAEAMARLPEDYRQVLELRYQEELPFEDIAQRLQRSAGAVRKLWLRAVERLRQELETSA